MTARDDCEALTTGTVPQELAKKAKPVYEAKPSSIDDLATAFTTASTSFGTVHDAVGRSVTTLDGAWEGTSADNFVTYMGTYKGAGDSLKSALTNAAADLKGASQGLSGAKTALENNFSKLHSDITSYLSNLARTEHGLPQEDKTTQQQKAAHIDELAGQYRSLITEQVTNAENAVKTASTALGKRAGEINPKFSTMQLPNQQPWVPGPNKPIEWTVSPEQKPGATNPSSDAPPSAQTNNGTGSGSGNGNGYSGGGGDSSSGGDGDSGGAGGMGDSGGPPAGKPPGNVDQWIREAIKILQENGVPVTDENINQIWQIIQHESGGNPNAINLWDSNAKAGHPSKGLMQCIDSTFNAHKLAGHDNIYNPVDNIIAGVRYSISRYGSLSNVPGLKAIGHGGGYVGY